jgi:NAD(P)H-hydrate repair Nnr-like enzyme with NAD(P)H-hydrate dehydratase domain
MQMAIPEVMVLTDIEKKHLYDCIRHQTAGGRNRSGNWAGGSNAKALHEFLITNSIPLVIDADALNILSKNRSWLSLLPSKSILTPHKRKSA